MIAGALEVQLFADIARIKADMEKAAGYVTAGAGAMEKAARAARVALGGIAAGLSVAALTSWIKSAIDAADATDKMAQKMGVSARHVAGLELAFKQAGLGTGDMTKAMSQLSKEVVEGGKGLAALGIKTKGTDGQLRGTMAVLYDVADALAVLPDGFQKNALAAEIFGAKLGIEMIPLLNGGSAGLREMAEMAAKLGLVISDQTAKQADQFNDTVELVGLGTQGVARGIAAQLLPTLTSLAGSFLESMTSGDRLANTARFLGTMLKGLYSVGLGIIELFTTVGKVVGGVAAFIGAQVSGMTQSFRAIGQALGGDFSGALETMKAAARNSVNVVVAAGSDIAAGWADTAKSISRAWSEEGNAAVAAAAKLAKTQKDLLAAAKAREEAAKKAAAAALKEAEEFQKLRDKLEGKDLGVEAGFIKTLKLIETEGKKAGLSLAEIIRLKELYIAQQPYMVEQAKAQKKADDEAAKAVDALFASRHKLFDQAEANEQKAKDLLAAIEFETAGLRMTNVERETAIALRELERSGLDKSTEAYKLLAEQIPKAIADREALKESQAMWESIDKTAHDTFVNIFESGSSAIKKLGQTLKAAVLDLLYQMTVKKWIIGIGTTMTGGVAGAATDAAGGGIMSAIGSSAMSLGGSALTSLAGGATLTGTLGGVFGAGFTGGAAAGFTGGMELAGALASSGAYGGAAGAALGAIGPVGWVALAAMALWAMFGKDGGGPKQDGKSGTTFTGIGAADNSLAAAVSPLVAGLQNQYDALAKSFGGEAAIQFGMAISRDPQGDSPTFLEVAGSRNGVQEFSNLNRNVGRDDKDLEAAIKVGALDALIGALKASDLSPQFAAFFATVAADADQATKAAALSTASNARMIYAAFENLGPSFSYVSDMTVEATARLIEAGGGMEKFSANLASYYENFYTAEEKRQDIASSISSTLAGSGVALSADELLGMGRGEFRALVEQFAQMGPAGEDAYMALLGVNGAFASITPAVDELAESTQGATEAAKIYAEWQQRLSILRGETTEREIALQADLATAADEATRAIIREVYAQEDLASGLGSLSAELSSLFGTLNTAMSNFEAALNTVMANVAKPFDDALAENQKLIDAANKAHADRVKQIEDQRLAVEEAYQAERKRLLALKAGLEAAFAIADARIKSQITLAQTAEKVRVAAYRAALADIGNQRDAAVDAYQAANELLIEQIDGATGTLDKLRRLGTALTDTLKSMRLEGADVQRQYRAAAQAQLAAALATARAGGQLPELDTIRDALAEVAKPSENLFSSFVDYARDFHRTAIDIDQLNRITGNQIDDAQSTLDVLRATKEAADKQHDAALASFDAQRAALEKANEIAEQQYQAAVDGLELQREALANKLQADVSALNIDALDQAFANTMAGFDQQLKDSAAALAAALAPLAATAAELAADKAAALQPYLDLLAAEKLQTAALGTNSQALRDLTAALNALDVAQAGMPTPSPVPADPALQTALAQAQSLYAGNPLAVKSPEAANVQFWADQITSNGFAAAQKTFNASVATLNTLVHSWYANHPDAVKNPGASDIAYWLEVMDDKGTDGAKRDFAAVVASITGKPALSINSFEVGTNYVPQNMLAQIHEGERIVPKADNAALMNLLAGGGSRREELLEAALDRLSTKVDKLVTAADKTAAHTGKSKDLLDRWEGVGMPETRTA